ncbi:uncharacterized protein LOC129885080 [Solanum dulcamara]|uniref:uncharacterized protein LOC129885080 n=1 Tax=Solanum dulcamara TaxID=45834 RepID=UPI0024864624|nr:uncharacterized protein LOC129885080 [Solanum dulcamara]
MSFPSEESDSSTNSVQDEQIKLVQLKMQFHGTRKEDLETIESYVKKLKSLANSLAEMDSPISDSDMVLQLLAGLPTQYLPLQKTISSKWPLPTFEEACSMVYMQEGILLQDEEEQSRNDPRGAGAEQSSSFYSAENFDAAVNALGSLSAVVGAVSVVGSAGWKIWQALARK